MNLYIYMFVILKTFYVFMLIFWIQTMHHHCLFILNCVSLCLVEFHVYVSGFDGVFSWIVCLLVWNCLYMSGFQNDYFLLYLGTKLYIACFPIWTCILYVYFIEITYVHVNGYMNVYLWISCLIWNCNHVFVVLNYEFQCVCIM